MPRTNTVTVNINANLVERVAQLERKIESLLTPVPVARRVPSTPPPPPRRAPLFYDSDTEEEEVESDSDSEDEDYDPEPEKTTLGSMMTQLDKSGNKAQTFAAILRNNFAWPNKDINRAYNLVNGSHYNVKHKTTAEEVTPAWWGILRGNDYDKTRKAREIFEYMIAQCDV